MEYYDKRQILVNNIMRYLFVRDHIFGLRFKLRIMVANIVQEYHKVNKTPTVA